MVSRIPVFSGKRVGKRIAPEMVLPVFVLVVLFFALLVSYPWEVLTACTLAYLACLPFGWLAYRNHQRKANPASISATQAAAGTESLPAAQAPPVGPAADHAARPTRLN
jgi:CDP-diacylglycerol--serine O-phosphatidyltransferase